MAFNPVEWSEDYEKFAFQYASFKSAMSKKDLKYRELMFSWQELYPLNAYVGELCCDLICFIKLNEDFVMSIFLLFPYSCAISHTFPVSLPYVSSFLNMIFLLPLFKT